MKRGFSTLYLSPFCLHSLCIFALCTIVESLHPTRASKPSLCPWGEGQGEPGWLSALGSGDWDRRVNDEFF